MIQYINLEKQNQIIKNELINKFVECLNNGDFILGSEVEKLEKRIAQLLGVKYAVGVNSCTDALILSLKALGIKEGDEVITVSNSFVATASAIVLCGGIPVFVDIDDTQLMDIRKLKKAITEKTKAIIPVHLMGIPTNMKQIMRIAKEHKLKVIEDAAQAIGAKINNKYVGSFGDTGCFSFHPLKNLGACGDGGIIVTNNNKVHHKLKLLRNIGLKDRDNCIIAAGNSRLDNIQAGILNVKLDHLEDITLKKRLLANYYFEMLKDIEGIILPYKSNTIYSVYHTYIIRVAPIHREALIKFLYSNGIESKIHYPKSIHQQKAFRKYAKRGNLITTEKIVNEIISLPIDFTMTLNDIEYICKTIHEFYKYN